MATRREEIEKAAKMQDEAADAEYRSKQRVRERERKANSSVLMGKAGAMGEPISAYSTRTQADRDKDASKAYDHMQNYDESRAEDERTKQMLLAAKLKALRSKKD